MRFYIALRAADRWTTLSSRAESLRLTHDIAAAGLITDGGHHVPGPSSLSADLFSGGTQHVSHHIRQQLMQQAPSIHHIAACILPAA